MSVKVIASNADSQTQSKDMPEIERRHQDAMKRDPMWPYFGGVITIGHREYQVIDDGPVK